MQNSSLFVSGISLTILCIFKVLRNIMIIQKSLFIGDDTESNVRRLCFKAQNPVRKDLIDAMGVANLNITCGAVCVYPSRIPDAVKALHDARSSVPVASVAAGFPAGKTLFRFHDYFIILVWCNKVYTKLGSTLVVSIYTPCQSLPN